MSGRVKILSEIIPDSKTAILLIIPANRFYFTEFNCDFGYLIISPSQSVFVTDSRYIEAAKSAKIKGFEIKESEIIEYCGQNCLHDILKKSGISSLLLETDITFRTFDNLRKSLPEINLSVSTELTEKILSMRSVKEEKELKRIQTAAEIASLGFNCLLPQIKEGITEKELALRLEYFVRQNGAEKMSFDTISISGSNTSLPHGVPTDKPLQKGDFITLDFGAVFEGYCSDMTRTLALGFATDEMKQVYNIVKSAQEKALSLIKQNVLCGDVDKAARDFISANGYGDYFRHSTGHGVGIEIHEKPNVTISDNTPLKTGMVITAEPGIYIENKFGVRIEDMVSVIENGFINYSSPTKELIIL